MTQHQAKDTALMALRTALAKEITDRYANVPLTPAWIIGFVENGCCKDCLDHIERDCL